VEAGALVITENPERPYLKWLGVLFDKKLTFKHHVQAQTAKAMKTARAFSSFGNTLRGVSAPLTRQAVIACVLPIAYFAAETWWPGREKRTHSGVTSNRVDKLLRQLEKVTLTSARAILPVFSTTPAAVLLRESGLSPPELKLEEIALRATVRIRRLDTQHPLRIRADAVQGPFIPTRRNRFPTRLVKRLLSLPPSEQLDMLVLPPWFIAVTREASHKRVGAPDPSLSKERNASTFIDFIASVPENQIVVYTDGSKLENGNAGAGYAISQFGHTHKESYPLGPSAEIFDAEAIAALLGARAALIHPTNRLAKDLWVCLDNLEVAVRLLSPSLTSSQSVFDSFVEVREAWKNRDTIFPGGDIYIRWVPGHTGVLGNELADIEARKGSSLPPNFPFPLSFASLERWQRQQASNARDKWWRSAMHERYRLLSITDATVRPRELQLPRNLLGRIIAARSNHGDFADYHQRFNRTNAELYCSCNARKTCFHFFFCRIARRHARRPPGPPSSLIPNLLGTSAGIVLLTEWWRKNRFFEDTCPYRKAS
jgi:ribonuclease HI